MTHRFATFEDAALFTSMKRDQGYFAEVLHVHVGHLWGPLAMSGFSVLVSEFAADDGEEVPEWQPPAPAFSEGLSAAVAFTTIAVISILLGSIGLELLRNVIYYPRIYLIPAVSLLLYSTAVVVFFSWLGWALSELTRIYRNPDHRLHSFVHALHAVLTWLMILFRVI